MHHVLGLFLAALLVVAPVWDTPDDRVGPPGVAWADDDDDGDSDDGDDDGDDDDSDDDGGGRSGGSGASGASGGGGGQGGRGSGRQGGDGSDGQARLPRGDGNDPVSRWLRRLIDGPAETRQTARPRAPLAPQVSPRPVARLVQESAEPDEVLTFALSPADLAQLVVDGFSVIETGVLAGLGVTFHRLSVAPDLDLPTALAQVRALPSGQASDLNHFYRAEQGASACDTDMCGPVRQIDWPDPASCAPVGAPIGVIDTAVNTDHDLLAAARIDTVRTASPGTDPAPPGHGTAVAALLVGAPDRGFRGLVPEARLIAVDAFHAVGRDARADTLALLRGLSLLAERGVRTVNLSLAGPANILLEQSLARLAQDDVLVVAAAGNGGPGAPDAFPAAYDTVVAVTAVDRANAVFRRAQRGSHVELAAPGVDVWTAASVSGLRRKTGTSFAVPFVTAALAQARVQAPGLSATDLRGVLGALARDLGEPGPDPIFGKGLLSVRGLCGSAQTFPASVQTGAKKDQRRSE